MIERPDLTVILPLLNEEAVLPELYRRLTAALAPLGRVYELLFVDDGSTDRTLELLETYRAEDGRVRVISFSRNFGQHAAMTAGLEHARGRAVVLMDADLQDQPEEIPRLWARLEEGWDVVYATLDRRREHFAKAWASAAFWWVFSLLTGVKLKSPGVFRIARRCVVLALRRLPERSRFVSGLFLWVGFRQTTLLVDRAPRAAGTTKYSLRRLVTLSVHAITGFSRAPLRLAVYLAGLMVVGALAMVGWVLWHRLFHGVPILGWASLMATVLTGFALTFLLLGIIGEYLGIVLAEAQGRPLYLVARRLGVHEDAPDPEEPRP